MSTPSARYPALEAEVKSILQYLSGHDLAGVDTAASFFDLGFDSLLLTQASQLFRQKFGIKITFRQLMEDLVSINAVTAYLDQNVAPDKFAPPAPKPITVPATRPAIVSPAPALNFEPIFGAADPDFAQRADRLIRQQLQVMAEQLDLLRSLGGTAPAPVAEEETTNGTGEHPRTEPAPTPAAPAPTHAEPPAPRYFGPFKPIDRSPGGGLNDRQQKHLDALMEAYLAKTARSRAYTQKHRAHLADPRTVAGFRQTWKEIVYPIVTKHSAGTRLWDLDNNEYLDVTLGFGVHFFGHSPEFAVRAQQWQLRKGVEVGPQSAIVGKVAALMCELTGAERAAFCSTGSEAVLAAIRLARTVTGRTKIATMAGAYHGINDEMLVRGTMVGGQPKAVPIAPGIPQNFVDEVLVLDYGSPASLELLRAHAHELAAVLVEPVQSRAPDLQPVEFLKEVRRITEESETALILDEIVTGFRVHSGGIQALWGIKADLATYGKVIGGGMPIGAICGSAKYMDALDGGQWQYGDASFPEVGMTFFAGTFVRHQLAIRSTLSVLSKIKREGPALQEAVSARCGRLAAALNAWFEQEKLPLRMTRFRSMLYFRFQDEFKFSSLLYFHLRLRGLHIWEARPVFLSTVHTDEDVDFIVRVFKESLEALREGGFLPEAETAPDKILPLPEAEQGLWYMVSANPSANRAYHESVTLSLNGPVDSAAVRAALQTLVDRHEALRTVIAEDGQSQTVQARRAFELHEIDYTGLPPEDALANATQRLFEIEGITFTDLRGPFLYACLVHVEPKRHLLFFEFHHLIGNGPSYWVFLNEFVALYNEKAGGAPANLPPAMTYSEFIGRRLQYDNSDEKKEAEAFWVDQFSSGVPVLELPVDSVRPAEITYGGERQEIVLKPELNAALRRLGAAHSASMFMMLFAGYSLLLHRLSGQDDIVIGVPFDSFIRAEESQRSLFGTTTNMLPIRSQLEDGISFLDYLRQIKDLVMRASEHQDYFFGNLIRKLNVPRDPSRAPFFTVTFNFESGEFRRTLAGGVELALELNSLPYRSAHGTAMFDLYPNLAERTNGEIVVQCDHNIDFILPETVRRWLRHYEVLLEGIAAEPEKSTALLPLMTKEERQELVISGT